MKKTIMLFIAIAAMCGTAEPKRRIFLDNGETKLSLLNLAATSGEITGIECITANNSGTLKLEVGKQMDTRKRVTSYKYLYETNVVSTLNHLEYTYTCECIWFASNKQVYTSSPVYDVSTNVYKQAIDVYGHLDSSAENFFLGGYKLSDWKIVDKGNASTNLTIYVGTMSLPGGGYGKPFSGGKTIEVPDGDGTFKFTEVCQDDEYATEIFTLNGVRSDVKYVYDYTTNITHIGTITNVTWQPVKRTIYRELISTNLTGGINISHLAEPCDVFVGDSLKVTSPISNENPGKFGIILSY